MSGESERFVVDVEGSTDSIDQLETVLHGLADEGERNGVTVNIRRVREHEDVEQQPEFKNGALD